MTSTQLVYAYPVFLSFEDAHQNEVFITFQEPNFFNNPWSSLGLKISASIIWLIGLCGSGFICTFVFYETQGYAASFRTVINQLVTWCYFYVSLCIRRHIVKITLKYFSDRCISNHCRSYEFDPGMDRTVASFYLLPQFIAERRNRKWISISDVRHFCYEISFHLQVETIKTHR